MSFKENLQDMMGRKEDSPLSAFMGSLRDTLSNTFQKKGSVLSDSDRKMIAQISRQNQGLPQYSPLDLNKLVEQNKIKEQKEKEEMQSVADRNDSYMNTSVPRILSGDTELRAHTPTGIDKRRQQFPKFVSDILYGRGMEMSPGEEIIPGVTTDKFASDTGFLGFFYEALTKSDQRNFDELVFALGEGGISQERAGLIASGQTEDLTPHEQKIVRKKEFIDLAFKGLESLDFIPIAGAITKPGRTLLKETVIRALVQKNNKSEIQSILSKTDDVFRQGDTTQLSEILARTSNPEEARVAIDNFVESAHKSPPVRDVVGGEAVPASATEPGHLSTLRESPRIPDEVKEKLAGVSETKPNKELVDRAVNRIATNFEDAKRFALSGSTDETIATARWIEEVEYPKRYFAETDPQVKSRIADEMAEFANKFAEINSRDAGRALQAHQVVNTSSPATFLRGINQMIAKENSTEVGVKVFGRDLPSKWFNPKKQRVNNPIKPLSGEEYMNYFKRLEEIEKMPNATNKHIAQRQILEELQKRVPSGGWDQIIATIKAGLLTGTRTTGLNISSTFHQGVTGLTTDVVATGIDIPTAWITGQRVQTVVFPKPSEMWRGIKQAPRFLKTGVSERTIQDELMGKATDHIKVNFPNTKTGDALQKYTDTVFRIIAAGDLPFFFAQRTMALERMARIKILNDKMKFPSRKAKREWIDNFVQNPNEDYLELATQEALVPLFQNDTIAGRLAIGMRSAIEIKTSSWFGTVKPLEPLVFFAKTPGAVITNLIQYSPEVATLNAVRAVKKGDQKEFVKAMAKGITGVGYMYMGIQFYNNDKITLSWPKDETEARTWEANGTQPNAINIGGVQLPLIFLGTSGMVMARGAYFQEAYRKTGSLVEASLASAGGGLSTFMDNSFVLSLKNILDVMEEPENKTASYVRSQTSMFVPTLLRDIARSMDDTRRDPHTLAQSFATNIPLLSQTVRPKLNVWGMPIDQNLTAFNAELSPEAFASLVFRLSRSIDSQLNSAIQHFNDNGVPVNLSRIPRTSDGVRLSDDEYFMYQWYYGGLVEKDLVPFLSTESFQSLPVEAQSDYFASEISRLKSRTKQELYWKIVRQKYDIPETVPEFYVEQAVKQINREQSKLFGKISERKQAEVIKNYIRDTYQVNF